MLGRIFSGNGVVAIGFVVLFVSGGSRHTIGLVLKPMVETFAWDRGTLGGAVALFLVVSALCMFFAGHLADRYSMRTILGGGLLVSAAGIGLMGLVSQPWQVFALYGVAFAVGNGVVSITPVGVMVSRQFPDKAGMANAVAVSGMGLGQLVIIAALATVMIGLGWRSVFGWLGVVNLALIPFVLWAVKDDRASSTATPAPATGLSVREALGTGHFWLLIAVYALCGFQDFFVSTHIVAFALDQNLPPLMAGYLLAFMGLAGLVGVIAAGIWSDRFSPISATVICFAIRAAIFSLVLISKDPVSIAIFAALFGFTFWITAPLTVVFVRNAFGSRKLGTLSGLVSMAHHLFGGLGAWSGAAVFDSAGNYDPSFFAMLVTSLAAIPLSFRLRAATN